MNKFREVNILRYMGNKKKLLDFIIPEIQKITKEGDLICDIMAGTSSIGFALSDRNQIISNDVQFYSFIISSFLLDDKKNEMNISIQNDINSNYEKNIILKKNVFFTNHYSDTYFSKKQCIEIDSLIFSIQNLKDHKKKIFYTSVLLSTLCSCQSTTGHFAQFLPSSNSRVKKIQTSSIKNIFDKKVLEFLNIPNAKFKNISFNLDYNDLLKHNILKNVKCFYLDPPYTGDQYSRFYHILETAAKMDMPSLDKNKAKYRNDRFQSGFCYKKSAKNEFENIISFCYRNNSNLIISYSTTGIIKIDDLISICKLYYKNIEIKKRQYSYSKQGRGNLDSYEVLIILKI